MNIGYSKIATSLFAIFPLMAGLGALSAQETPSIPTIQTGVAVTIYNQNLAMVKDQRHYSQRNTVNDLVFSGVSDQIRPETALLQNLTDGEEITVLEQNFNYDLLTPAQLLEKSVGQIVQVVMWDEAAKQEKTVDALVLSTAEGIVLKIGDRIETEIPGRIIYKSIPAGLRPIPTLTLKINQVSHRAMKEQLPTEVQLSYLTGGLSWQADYVAKLNADETRLDLTGFVTLTNETAVTFENAQLQLVAGDLNLIETDTVEEFEDIKDYDDSPEQERMTEEALFEYHLYSLPRLTTIRSNQTKQVSLLAASSVAVGKQYVFNNLITGAEWEGEDSNEIAEMIAHPAVILKLLNNTENGLGMPLPKGTVRLYKNDQRGQPIFVGEDLIAHTPVNETVNLQLGYAFDLTAHLKATNYHMVNDTMVDISYEVVFHNAKSEPVTIIMNENAGEIDYSWEITQENYPGQQLSAQSWQWTIPVPANGSATLQLSFRASWDENDD